MPVLPDPRYETFAQRLAQGDTADKAHQRAGFKANRGNAARLKAKQSIQDRVKEILGATAKQVQDDLALDAKSIFRRILKRAEAAAKDGDHKTALDAEKFIAECFGYKDSPTLTHEHVNGKPMVPVERQPQEGEPPRVCALPVPLRPSGKPRRGTMANDVQRGC